VFRWGPRLSTKWEVSLLRPDRAVVWSVRTDGVELLFPAAEQELEPGARLLWRVVAVDLPGRPEARGGFAVATLEERRAFEAAREELGRLADRRVRLLLEAHLALRRGWASEAEAAARAFVAEHPDDPLGRQTLRHARALTGRSRPD
jgi:hypothetical protein